MNHSLQDLMREATRLTRDGRLKEATALIQRAMGEQADADNAPAQRPGAAAATPRTRDASTAADSALVLDGCVFEVEESATVSSPVSSPTNEAAPATARAPATEPAPAEPPSTAPAPATGRGEFTLGTQRRGTQSLHYKLYIPPGDAGRTLPLVVMLHGCTQNPDDFAIGTAMNERAREQGFFVLYPAQSQNANPQRCWNWFKHNHQQRGSGEPALIADMTLAVIKQHGIDARRVYIAGLSAGGAMAAIVGAAYPEIFAAIGVHSGLPRGAARNLPEALAAMKGGTAHPAGVRPSGQARPQGATVGAVATSVPAAATAPGSQVAVPTIVFHGDQDTTVHPHNGEQVIAAVLASAAATGAGTSQPTQPGQPRTPHTEQGISTHGRRFTRTVHLGNADAPLAEYWQVHGAGHAWSGGRAKGSYTDPAGPDATREMLRFFFEHPHTVIG